MTHQLSQDIALVKSGSKWHYTYKTFKSPEFEHCIDALMDLHKSLGDEQLQGATIDAKMLGEAIMAYKQASIDLIKSFGKFSEQFYKHAEAADAKPAPRPKLAFFGGSS